MDNLRRRIETYIEEQDDWGLGEFFFEGAHETRVKSKTAQASLQIKNNQSELNTLFESSKNCLKCPLGKTRLNFVFGVGNPESPLMFVGEGPGFDEDHKGEPFVGRAGKLLDKIIEAMKLKRADVYITNITKCHPMIEPSNPEKRGNDRPPTAKEMASCIPYLERQIEIIQPKVICALGNTAAQGLLRTEEKIGNLRGQIFELSVKSLKIKLVPTYHPAALLRNPSLKATAWSDIKLVLKLLSEETCAGEKMGTVLSNKS